MAHLFQDNAGELVGPELNWTVIENIIWSDARGDGRITDDDEIYQMYLELDAARDNGTPQPVVEAMCEEFRDALYERFAADIFVLMNYDFSGGTFNNVWWNSDIIDIAQNDTNYHWNEGMTWESVQEEFAYYVNLWESIHDAGGYEIIASNYESGEEGNEWFQNMIEAGLISLKELKGGICGGWSDVNIATSIGDNFFQEVPDDDRAKRAEVEYEHTLDVIDHKEQKLDTALKKLETEEKALNTQEEGLKQMIKDATENTFNLFS